MGESRANLVRGALEPLILKALSWGPRHGYGVADWIGGATGDELLVEEGTLYPALHRLEARGLVEAEWGLSENNRRAKFYSLTASGEARLRSETAVWTRYAQAVGRALSRTTEAGP